MYYCMRIMFFLAGTYPRSGAIRLGCAALVIILKMFICYSKWPLMTCLWYLYVTISDHLYYLRCLCCLKWPCLFWCYLCCITLLCATRQKCYPVQELLFIPHVCYCYTSDSWILYMSNSRLVNICHHCVLLYFCIRLWNKLLVGDDQACLGENVTAVDLSALATAGFSVQ